MHHPQCPCHEDYELEEQAILGIDPADLLALVRAAYSTGPTLQSRVNLNKALKPFGWMLDCKCAEIAQADKEYQQEMRQDR